MKSKKSFFITFIVTYLIIGYFSAVAVGIKWDSSATLLTRFLTRGAMAFIDKGIIKIVFALVCAQFAIYYLVKSKKFNFTQVTGKKSL